MGFSIADVPAEQRIEFTNMGDSSITCCHVFRGVSAGEYDQLIEEGRRATVTTGENATPEERAAAFEANRESYLKTWGALVLRVEGYDDADGLEGEALRDFFAGRGPIFEALPVARARVVRDELLMHVKAAVNGWIELNSARFSFRRKAEGGGLVARP